MKGEILKRWILTRESSFQRATDCNRFSTFTLGQTIVLVPDFLAKRISANLMNQTIWLPLALSIGSLILSILVVFWSAPTESTGQQSADYQLDLASVASQFCRSLRVLFTSRMIFFLIITFSFTNVFGQLMSGSIMLQVLKKKFGTEIPKVSIYADDLR